MRELRIVVRRREELKGYSIVATMDGCWNNGYGNDVQSALEDLFTTRRACAVAKALEEAEAVPAVAGSVDEGTPVPSRENDGDSCSSPLQTPGRSAPRQKTTIMRAIRLRPDLSDRIHAKSAPR